MKKMFLGAALFTAALASCKKDTSATDTATSAAIQAAAASVQAVAVATSTTTTGDSVYVINTCSASQQRTPIDFSALPAAITSYLSTNYSGYTAVKAFSITDSAGTITGYVVIIQYNGKPVGIKFDASGNFVKVLEQREGHDLLGQGWHHGGCFDNRDGQHRDTVALSSLPAAVLTYMQANYASDTLLHAFINRDGNYVILSRNNGLYATVFTSAGTFISHLQLPAHGGNIAAVSESALPPAISSYLTATYPGYVFEKAFSLTVGGVLKNYCVVIDANNTKYALLFDASGNFVAVKLIH